MHTVANQDVVGADEAVDEPTPTVRDRVRKLKDQLVKPFSRFLDWVFRYNPADHEPEPEVVRGAYDTDGHTTTLAMRIQFAVKVRHYAAALFNWRMCTEVVAEYNSEASNLFDTLVFDLTSPSGDPERPWHIRCHVTVDKVWFERIVDGQNDCPFSSFMDHHHVFSDQLEAYMLERMSFMLPQMAVVQEVA